MTNSSFSIIESVVPEKIIRSGDFENAEILIKKIEVSSEKIAEIFYLLGNKFLSSNQKNAAELSWKESKWILLENEKEKNNQKLFLKDNRKVFTKTIAMILILFLVFYLFLIVFFKRESEKIELGFENNKSKGISLWERWWDTGRPRSKEFSSRYGVEDLWPLINKTLENLFGEREKILNNNVKEKLKRWLELSQIPKFKDGPTDNYALIARGLFEAREFDDALSTLNNSIKFAENSQELEKIYQDLGTVYYYRGYKLRPNGLANYDISDVKKSVQSYEMALKYGEDPYLYGNLGWGYYLLENFSSSIENSIKALNLRPELNYVRMNLGIAYLKKGNHEMSFSAYASILKYDPQPEEYEGGIRDLMELQMKSPGSFPFSDFVLGQLFWQQGLYKKSQYSLRKFILQKFNKKIWKERANLMLEKMIKD